MSTTEIMQALAAGLDEALNGDAKGADRKVGFVLLTFPFGVIDGGRVNYVSNGQRDDVRASITELLGRWEGRYSEPGQKQ